MLFPVTTMKSVTPDDLLKSIFWSCTKECGTRCSCNKSGVHCTDVCKNCTKNNCINMPETQDEDSLKPQEIWKGMQNEYATGNTTESENRYL